MTNFDHVEVPTAERESWGWKKRGEMLASLSSKLGDLKVISIILEKDISNYVIQNVVITEALTFISILNK